MKKMKTLTVNGVTYTVTDPNATKNVVDLLCTSFEKSGAMVTCEPVEGYPLTVTADASATTVTRCGKNLAKLRSTTSDGLYGLTATKQSDNTILVNGTSTFDSPNNIYLTNYLKGQGSWVPVKSGKYTIKVEVISGTITGAQIVLATNTGGTNSSFFYVALNTAYTFTMSTDGICAAILQFSTGGTATNAKVRVQIEKGNTATAFEPYTADTFAPGEDVPALAGVNNIWADAGEVTVTGRADPIALNKKTEERLAALEAAWINT